MKQPNETKRWQRAEELFTLLADGDRDRDEICADRGWDYSQMRQAVQQLRDMLAADGDVINVVAEPNGWQQPWMYGLRDGGAILDPEQSRWMTNRLGDTERRIKTISHVLDAAVNATDGRTVEGRKARIYELHLRRAAEEVALMDSTP
ncbi:MAG: hypothetical protein GEU73_07710 [Chloroflexi bacterium]|nr:hypothetical protein [Chloroflexota bacterium]